MSSLSTAATEADNSSVIGHCDIGSMPLPVRFKSALLANNCDRCGLPLKTITQSTKNSTAMTLTRSCAKSGRSAGIHFGVTQILQQALRIEFWGYTNQVRLRGLTENQPELLCEDFVTCAGRFCLYSCGFNRQVQDMRWAKVSWLGSRFLKLFQSPCGEFVYWNCCQNQIRQPLRNSVSIPLRGICLLKLAVIHRATGHTWMFQSPCGEFVYWNLQVPSDILMRLVGFNPLAENLFIETQRPPVRQEQTCEGFNPLAGNLFIETCRAVPLCSCTWLVSIPLRGICLLKPRRTLHVCSSGYVSIPLRGICLLKRAWLSSVQASGARFNPLAGNLFIETSIEFNMTMRAGEFQSPCGEFVYWNSVQTERIPMLSRLFQSPCGEFVYWNIPHALDGWF